MDTNGKGYFSKKSSKEDRVHSKDRTKVRSNHATVPILNEHSVIFTTNVDIEETEKYDLWK